MKIKACKKINIIVLNRTLKHNRFVGMQEFVPKHLLTFTDFSLSCDFLLSSVELPFIFELEPFSVELIRKKIFLIKC